jgi:hypothetical protein
VHSGEAGMSKKSAVRKTAKKAVRQVGKALDRGTTTLGQEVRTVVREVSKVARKRGRKVWRRAMDHLTVELAKGTADVFSALTKGR